MSGGLTHRLTSGKAGAKVVQQVGNDIDQAIANPVVRWEASNKINQMARDLADNDTTTPSRCESFSPNQGALATATSLINDERTMKVFLGAMTGSQRHIDELANIGMTSTRML